MNSKVWKISALAIFIGIARGEQPSLEDGWKNPPVEARLRAYWWWLNGNVTKAAITKDLEGMKAQGMGGALIFDANGAEQQGNNPVPAGPMFGSPEWRELFIHALREGDRLGLKLALNIQSGWNLGGPTVTPELATKHLVWSSKRVDGPAHFDAPLPKPEVRENYYRDIVVIAVPAQDLGAAVTASSEQQGHPARDAVDGKGESFWVSQGTETGRGPTATKPEWLQIDFGRDVVAGGIRFAGRDGYGPRDSELSVESARGKFKSLTKLASVKEGETSAVFPVVTGRVFRLTITSAYDPKFPASPRNVQLAEFNLLGANRKPIATSGGATPIRKLRIKAGYDEIGGSAPDGAPLLDDDAAVAGERALAKGDAIELTAKLQADGRLVWDVPAGSWDVLRFGYTPNGAHVSTSSGNWKGLVIDYLNDRALRWYWNQHVVPLLDVAGPLCGKTFTHIQTDSWELGGVNWTDDFAEQFKKLRGYDLAPWFPVLAGRIVGNRELSNRFLADFRRTIGDLVADRHYAVMAELAHARGLSIQPESGGPHGAPLDGMKCMGRDDMPMSEFWVPSPHRPREENRFFVKQASSTAHVYGRRVTCAEGFTSIGPHWNDILWSAQKPSFDHEACAGLNLVFWHAFTCSPQESGLPGQEYFAGTHFNPQVTWWKFANAFVGYLDRCQFMLQQGRPVADVLHYYGDWVPNFARRKQDDPAKVLPGYDYDVINEEALVTRLSFKDGRFVLPDGVSYRVLSLVDRESISLPVMRKLHEFSKAGGKIIGRRPTRTTGISNWPECDAEIAKLAGDTAIESVPARDALAALGVPQDIEFLNAAADSNFDGVHRATDREDIYFVCNQANREEKIDVAFRVASPKAPELWDPVSGEIRPLMGFWEDKGRIVVPLKFAPYGSAFVVFRDAQRGGAKGFANWPELESKQEIAGPWDVSFDRKWGGPAKATFAKLESWTQNSDEGIHNYSGTATYRLNFKSQISNSKSKTFLDLGDVMNIAQVRLNGKVLGTVWAPPFRVDATGAIHDGDNELEIEVVNTWFNRVWYEQTKKPATLLTQTNVRIKPGQQPLASGLLGPVRLLEEKR